MTNSECFKRNDFGVVTSCRWFGGFVDVKIRHHVHTEVFHGNFMGAKCRVHFRVAYFHATSMSKISNTKHIRVTLLVEYLILGRPVSRAVDRLASVTIIAQSFLV